MQSLFGGAQRGTILIRGYVSTKRLKTMVAGFVDESLRINTNQATLKKKIP
jgi:hypothetical protein